MRRGKFRFLLVTLLVASGLVFLGGEVRANFTSFNYAISAQMDVTSNNVGTYTYIFTPSGSSSTTIKNILFELPAEINYLQLTDPILKVSYSTDSITWVPLTFAIFPPGVGDPDTRLGLNDLNFSVLSVNPSSTGFSKSGFTLKLSLNGFALNTGRRLSRDPSKKQVVQLKAGRSLSDTDTVSAPVLEDIPPPPPGSPTVTIFSPNPDTVGYGHPECATLTWDSTGDVVAISGYGLVKGADIPENHTPEVCPKETTTYKITAISVGSGTSIDCTATITVIQPPPPVIEASQETVEKKDETTGQVTGYVTFYSMNGVLECACSTGQTESIIPYSDACKTVGPPQCTPASESDAGDLLKDNPLLVCVWVKADDPSTQCSPNDSEYCYNFGLAGKTYKCDKWALQTRDTIIEIGKKSCTCGFAKKLNTYGKIVSVWSCTGTTCASCNYQTCP